MKRAFQLGRLYERLARRLWWIDIQFNHDRASGWGLECVIQEAERIGRIARRIEDRLCLR